MDNKKERIVLNKDNSQEELSKEEKDNKLFLKSMLKRMDNDKYT